jgi:hypothetical protein
MPGGFRIDAAGALHHVMVRGIERIELFRGNTDSNHFAERPLDSGHGLWPRALAGDRVPSEGKSSRGRPERSVARARAILCYLAVRRLGIACRTVAKELNISPLGGKQIRGTWTGDSA